MTAKRSVVWGFYPGTHEVAGDFSDDVFSDDRLIGVGRPRTGDLQALVAEHRPVSDFVTVVRYAYQHNEDIAAWELKKCERWFQRSAGILHRFLCEAQPGYIVVFANKRNEQVYVGRIRDTDEGRYKYDASERNRFHRHFRHFRAVTCVSSVPYADCSAEDLSQARTQNIFWRMGEAGTIFATEVLRPR